VPVLTPHGHDTSCNLQSPSNYDHPFESRPSRHLE
jgi:hypothetical protein